MSPGNPGRFSWELALELVPRAVGPGAPGLAPALVVNAVEVKLRITNRGATSRTLTGWEALGVTLAPREPGASGHRLWAYCGASHEDRPDWLRPVGPDFTESGSLGMNASDYGGGNAVTSVWNSQESVAVGCLSAVPEVLAFPVERSGDGPLRLSVRWIHGLDGAAAPNVDPGQAYDLPPLWLAVSEGDGLTGLLAWRRAMEACGVAPGVPSTGAREATWCAWGYERGFTLAQVAQALPKVADLGFRWFTLDDGWQSEEGDVTLNPEKFPGGEQQMRAFVDDIHSRGLKAMLWWIPLAADPKSQWAAEHPDTLVRDPDGKTADITWWDCAHVCPPHPEVLAETRRQLRKFFLDWGFDGLKIDGQHLNAVPPCHDASHGHSDPGEPNRRLPEFWRLVHEVSEECRPGATILFCPCGTTYNVHSMPYYDMPVASDPSGSWQVRTKGLVFKALMAPDCAFHGDHVELSDREHDFASTVGIGGIVDTKFTWPPGSSGPSVLKPGGNFDLHEPDELRLRAWLKALRDEQLDQALYTFGFYRFGFEPVEVHVLDAGERRYYSCFAVAGPGEDSLGARWSGRLELRGLTEGRWKVKVWAEGADVADRDLGEVTPGHPTLDLAVQGSLLLRLDRVPTPNQERP